MKRVFIFLIPTIFILSCSRSNLSLDSYFPESQGAWVSGSKPRYYKPDNLYDYINGEAELYHAYSFRQLATKTYLKNGDEDSNLVVDLYDMGTILNAFGIYSNYRHPYYNFKKVGTEAVISDYGLRFLKDRYMIEIKADDSSSSTKTAVLVLAETIADRIQGEAVFPEELKLLPHQEQNEYTVRYIANGMLNLDFLPGGIEATYQINKEELTGFIIIMDESENVDSKLKAVQDFYKEMGFDTFEISEGGRFSIGVKTKYDGVILIRSLFNYMIGVRGSNSMESSYIILQELNNHLVSLKGK